MDFKKKFDYSDINNFLPDNVTLGRSEYFQKMFHDMMPTYVCDILELKTREEYDNINKDKLIEMIKQRNIEEGLNVWKEYETIVKESEESTTLDELGYNKC
jgi:hypothetical protein